jgi:hypothetical protein
MSEKRKILQCTMSFIMIVTLVLTTGVYSFAASPHIQSNVSETAVSANLSDRSLPTAVSTLISENTYHFNLATDTSNKFKSASLYLKQAGESSYSNVYSYTARNYFRYCDTSIQVTGSGTLYYYWSVKYADTGKTATFKTNSKTVKSNSQPNDYTQKVNNFINDGRWSNGISWAGEQRPKLSSYSSKGCCAYAADFVKYVFGKSGPRSGQRFTSTSSIKAGDVLHLSPNHWIVVLSRNGNSLYTAEGNASSKVVIKNGRYTISGSKLKTSYTTYSIADGYHFQ